MSPHGRDARPAPVVEAGFPGQEAAAGRCVFERDLGGRFLVQRTRAPDPAPDSMAIVSVEPETGASTQHYFDSRGARRPRRRSGRRTSG